MIAAALAALETRDWLGPLATLLVGLVTAGLVIRQLSALRRRNEFDILGEIGTRMSARLVRDERDGEHPFYALRHRFADRARRPEPRKRREYEEALAQRVKALATLSREDYRADLQLVKRVVNTLNGVAEVIDNRHIDHRKVLARYHLLLIREVFIVEPYIIAEVSLGTRGRWGMRVLELGRIARQYNDMNPLHRSSVYFVHNRHRDEYFGAIHGAPPIEGLDRLRLVGWAVRRWLFGYPRITERVKRRQNKMLRRFDDLLREVGEHPARTSDVEEQAAT